MASPILPNLSEDEFVYLSNEGLKRLNQIWNPAQPDKHLNWTTDYTVELPIRVRKEGYGAQTPFTLVEAFQTVVKKAGKTQALRVKRNNKWNSWTFQEYYDDTCNFAKGVLSLGLTPYCSVNILGFNAPEWFMTFYGSIFANYLPVGIYTTNGPDACKYITMHSDAEMVVVENRVQLAKYYKIWNELPKLKYIVVFNDVIPDDIPAERKGQIITFQSLLEIGKKYVPNSKDWSLEVKMTEQKPGNCCTLVYTSGTTGPPKGVMLSHDSYTWTAGYLCKTFSLQFANEKFVSFLPMSHVASQIIDMISPLLCAAEVTFAEPTALQGTLVDSLKETRPTFFLRCPPSLGKN